MSDTGPDQRAVLIAKLKQSREEIRMVLDPPRPEPGAAPADPEDTEFPRSRTMRALLSSKGLGAIGAMAGGLLIAKPTLALRMLRMVPAGTVGKMLLAKAVTSFREKYTRPR
jgi:hypothetical protein